MKKEREEYKRVLDADVGLVWANTGESYGVFLISGINHSYSLRLGLSIVFYRLLSFVCDIQ